MGDAFFKKNSYFFAFFGGIDEVAADFDAEILQIKAFCDHGGGVAGALGDAVGLAGDESILILCFKELLERSGEWGFFRPNGADFHFPRVTAPCGAEAVHIQDEYMAVRFTDCVYERLFCVMVGGVYGLQPAQAFAHAAAFRLVLGDFQVVMLGGAVAYGIIR